MKPACPREPVSTEELFSGRTRPFVARFLSRLGVWPDDLDDAVQEVFLVVRRNGGYSARPRHADGVSGEHRTAGGFILQAPRAKEPEPKVRRRARRGLVGAARPGTIPGSAAIAGRAARSARSARSRPPGHALAGRTRGRELRFDRRRHAHRRRDGVLATASCSEDVPARDRGAPGGGASRTGIGRRRRSVCSSARAAARRGADPPRSWLRCRGGRSRDSQQGLRVGCAWIPPWAVTGTGVSMRRGRHSTRRPFGACRIARRQDRRIALGRREARYVATISRGSPRVDRSGGPSRARGGRRPSADHDGLDDQDRGGASRGRGRRGTAIPWGREPCWEPIGHRPSPSELPLRGLVPRRTSERPTSHRRLRIRPRWTPRRLRTRRARFRRLPPRSACLAAILCRRCLSSVRGRRSSRLATSAKNGTTSVSSRSSSWDASMKRARRRRVSSGTTPTGRSRLACEQPVADGRQTFLAKDWPSRCMSGWLGPRRDCARTRTRRGGSGHEKTVSVLVAAAFAVASSGVGCQVVPAPMGPRWRQRRFRRRCIQDPDQRLRLGGRAGRDRFDGRGPRRIERRDALGRRRWRLGSRRIGRRCKRWRRIGRAGKADGGESDAGASDGLMPPDASPCNDDDGPASNAIAVSAPSSSFLLGSDCSDDRLQRRPGDAADVHRHQYRCFVRDVDRRGHIRVRYRQRVWKPRWRPSSPARGHRIAPVRSRRAR